MRLCSMFVVTFAIPCAASTIFVDDAATAAADGLSGSTAYSDIQDALDAARLDPTIDAIHVDAGDIAPFMQRLLDT